LSYLGVGSPVRSSNMGQPSSQAAVVSAQSRDRRGRSWS